MTYSGLFGVPGIGFRDSCVNGRELGQKRFAEQGFRRLTAMNDSPKPEPLGDSYVVPFWL